MSHFVLGTQKQNDPTHTEHIPAYLALIADAVGRTLAYAVTLRTSNFPNRKYVDRMQATGAFDVLEHHSSLAEAHQILSLHTVLTWVWAYVGL